LTPLCAFQPLPELPIAVGEPFGLPPNYLTASIRGPVVTASPEDFPSWAQIYANALQDALRKANARRKETLSQMTVDDWRIAVGREMRADMWYQNTDQENGTSLPLSPAVEAISASSNGNESHPKVSATAV
jgi:hypothetical protein